MKNKHVWRGVDVELPGYLFIIELLSSAYDITVGLLKHRDNKLEHIFETVTYKYQVIYLKCA